MYLFQRLWAAPLMALAFAGLSGCDDRTSTVDRHIAAAIPTQAVTQLVRDLRHNDLAGSPATPCRRRYMSGSTRPGARTAAAGR